MIADLFNPAEDLGDKVGINCRSLLRHAGDLEYRAIEVGVKVLITGAMVNAILPIVIRGYLAEKTEKLFPKLPGYGGCEAFYELLTRE